MLRMRNWTLSKQLSAAQVERQRAERQMRSAEDAKIAIDAQFFPLRKAATFLRDSLRREGDKRRASRSRRLAWQREGDKRRGNTRKSDCRPLDILLLALKARRHQTLFCCWEFRPVMANLERLPLPAAVVAGSSCCSPKAVRSGLLEEEEGQW